MELIVCVYRHHSVVALLGDPGKPDLQPNQTSWGASAFRLDSPFIAADDIARVRSTLPRGLRSQIGISRVSDWPYSGSVPSLTRTYDRTVFTPGVLRAAYKRFGLLLPDGSKPAMSGREVESARDKWSYDTNEEFLDALGEPHTRSYVIFCIGESNTGYHNARIVVDRFEARTTVTVEGEDRGHVLGMIEPFEDGRTRCRIPEPPTPPAEPPTVFIAHGRSSAWKTIRDELRKHGYAVEAYEEGARSGLTITELLGKMLGKSAFGVAVLTAEDEQADGGLRARQNVIHETGYLHGVLGVARVAILMESGVDQFTNIAGVQYIGITTSQPIVAMSDLLAHIRREFPQMPG